MHDIVPDGIETLTIILALVDRLSEVQEENCTMRRQVQRLDAELTAKTRALQIEMSKRLALGEPPSAHTKDTSDLGSTATVAGHALTSSSSLYNTRRPPFLESPRSLLVQLTL
ncbi:unnamed protein product [Echinostoma caproni]|uniref:Coiled-coil domain-containing protein 52 n=1 Tax=Echinostoma caproni TaxID=27848 RepID=A0A183ATH8_9TREM|nr:unnamed protein product [Echinostoma caproni]